MNAIETGKRKYLFFMKKLRAPNLLNILNLYPLFSGQVRLKNMHSNFLIRLYFIVGTFLKVICIFLTEVILNQDQESIMKRFTQVFAMTYRRFLDLKKPKPRPGKHKSSGPGKSPRDQWGCKIARS